MIHIEVPLVMKGGISIRQYAAKKNEPDFVHITSNGVPVISGSTFAGAIRHRVEQILGELEAGGTKLPVKKKFCRSCLDTLRKPLETRRQTQEMERDRV